MSGASILVGRSGAPSWSQVSRQVRCFYCILEGGADAPMRSQVSRSGQTLKFPHVNQKKFKHQTGRLAAEIVAPAPVTIYEFSISLKGTLLIF